MREQKTVPIDSIADFRRALAIARLPLPLRLLLIWLSLNIGRGAELHGQLRDLRSGFARGGIGATIPVWSSFLNYGPIAPDGGLDIYLSVDHRVIDCGQAVHALRALVLDELRTRAEAS
jgi:hypothetical protein